MISTLSSINIVVCEKILLEDDRTYSAIRIVDVFYFRRDPAIPLEEQEAIPMNILVMGKMEPADESEHWAQIVIRRPSGEATPIGPPLRNVFRATLGEAGKRLLADGSKESDIAGGFAIRADITIVPRQTGRHQIEVAIDGSLVAKAPFTILELKPLVSD